MTAKLFTIGDSISQGFMSGAAANTHQAFSTLLAEAMDIKDYRYLQWDTRFKTKMDLERILRTLEKRYGSNIRGLEWGGVFPAINSVLDQAEDYFERGEGRCGIPVDSPHTHLGFHNIAVEGMDVGDAYMVTAKKCRERIENASRKEQKDGFLSSTSVPFDRNAYRVLNPLGKDGEKKYGDFTAVDWLKHSAETEGVENVCLWLGANNALGTVLSLKVKPTPNNPALVLEDNREQRSQWNLWHPNDFRAEYKELLRQVMQAMQGNIHKDWHIFIGTVPLVTIAPLAKGVGEPRKVPDPARPKKEVLYYQYYTYFPMTMESGKKAGKLLKFRDALFIDETIVEFNKIIHELVAKANKSLEKERLHIVDTGSSLSEMAWKRNMGAPGYKYPAELAFNYPPVDTKYYHANPDGHIEKGGVFSLDGIHPTAIGQGLIAWEFLKQMKKARPSELKKVNLNWDKIIASDTLRNQPITLMQELYDHDKLVQFLASIGSILNQKD